MSLGTESLLCVMMYFSDLVTFLSLFFRMRYNMKSEKVCPWMSSIKKRLMKLYDAIRCDC